MSGGRRQTGFRREGIGLLLPGGLGREASGDGSGQTTVTSRPAGGEATQGDQCRHALLKARG